MAKKRTKRKMYGESLIDRFSEIVAEFDSLPESELIRVINEMRRMIHEKSPFKDEPVDFVQWIKSNDVHANDYNPNSVAPPEMELLAVSIESDGYTQPIVTWSEEGKRTLEVIDGFHRNRVGKERENVRKRVKGYLPVVVVNSNRTDRNDRIASTIRHNRARGKHRVDAMSDIVVELKRRNWSDERIARELGMDQDEILRLCQISGLAELFTDQQFSKSWDVEGPVTEADFRELSDDIETYGPEADDFRTVNTSDENRIFHTHDKWECYKAGFYATFKEGMTKEQCEKSMRDFLSNIPLFKKTLAKIIKEWKHSCEHYLTNSAMNRIAWLGQAAACYELGIPAVYRGGYYLLTEKQQDAANVVALAALNKWLKENGREPVTLEEAAPDREMEIY